MVHPLISVIVPVYNGEVYIAKCFQSILNQTYQNLEIIIINDGSEDGSGAICDYFSTIDKRVVVIHQDNKGLSAVRNKGVSVAKGDFIGFVDSDDQIHPKMYEELCQLLLRDEADIAMCGVRKIYEDDIQAYIEESDKGIMEERVSYFNRKQALENLFNERNLITVVPWNKLYRKQVFEYIRYPDEKVHDDEFVIHHLIQATKKIVYTDAVLYYYYHNEISFTNEKYNLKRLDAIEALKDRVLFFEFWRYDDMLQKGINTYLHLIIIHYYLVLKYLPTEKEVLRKLQEKFKKEFRHYRKVMNLKNKMELQFFFLHPIIYRSFIKVRKDVSARLPLNRM